jgi:VIT1/CCC1 family predicted Fe2+/Mn2+ transporter
MFMTRVVLIGVLVLIVTYAISAAIMVSAPYLALIIVFASLFWFTDRRAQSAEKKKSPRE